MRFRNRNKSDHRRKMKLPRGHYGLEFSYKEYVDLNNAMKQINYLFTEEQLEKLSVKVGDKTADLATQFFIKCVDNRYATYLPMEETVEHICAAVKKYKFLLDSNLDPDKIRHVFLRALLDTATFSSSLYLLKWRNHREKGWNVGKGSPIIKPYKLGYVHREELIKVFEDVIDRYPNLPKSRDLYIRYYKKYPNPRYSFFPFEEPFMCLYAYSFSKKVRRGEIDLEKYKSEFLNRNKWVLETLSKCNDIFSKKGIDRMAVDISESLDLYTDKAP